MLYLLMNLEVKPFFYCLFVGGYTEITDENIILSKFVTFLYMYVSDKYLPPSNSSGETNFSNFLTYLVIILRS